MIKSKKGRKIKPKRKVDNNTGCVYVLTDELYEKYNIFKIGYTTDLDSRISALSTGTPFIIYPKFVFKFEDNKEMEKRIHDEYSMWRLNREFFQLDPYVLADLKGTYYPYLIYDENMYFIRLQDKERLKIPFDWRTVNPPFKE